MAKKDLRAKGKEKSKEVSAVKKSRKTRELSSLKGKKPKESKKTCIGYSSEDYLVVIQGTKKSFGIAVGRNRLLLEKGVEDDETSETIDFEDSEVVANLGQTVAPGTSVFGFTVNTYEFTIVDKHWGKIHFYRKMKDDRELKYFKRMLKEVYDKLEELKATGFLPLNCIKVYQKKGKKVGCYRFNFKNGDSMDLMPEDFKDKKYNQYLLFHESAHGIWFRQVPKDIQVKWIDIYNDRINVFNGDKKKIRALAKEASVCEEGIQWYIKNECEGEDADLVRECLSYVKRVHKLNVKQLELYLEANGSDSIFKFWPKVADIGKPIPDISDYSMESYEEFFAEAFAYYMTGKKIPKDVKKLLKYTLKNLAKHYGD